MRDARTLRLRRPGRLDLLQQPAGQQVLVFQLAVGAKAADLDGGARHQRLGVGVEQQGGGALEVSAGDAPCDGIAAGVSAIGGFFGAGRRLGGSTLA